MQNNDRCLVYVWDNFVGEMMDDKLRFDKLELLQINKSIFKKSLLSIPSDPAFYS